MCGTAIYRLKREPFFEFKLPEKEAFYNDLDDRPISDADSGRVQQVWNLFGMQNMQNYRDLYLKTDVLLLADVFENFREKIYRGHMLDHLHYYTLPSLSWSMALKYTGVELQLLTEADDFLMLESGM